MTGIALANCLQLPLADNSVDMIFTDPPYLKEFLHVYGWLADEAMRVLKPGGFILAYCGGFFLNRIYRMFDDAGLTYFWQFVEGTQPGRGVFIYRVGILNMHKPIIAYSKGPARLRVQGVHSRFDSIGKMKAYHHWGQDVGTARYYIDHCSAIGDIVLDPFVGGGTTAVACEILRRRCVAFDIDLTALKTTQQRLIDPLVGPVWQPSLFRNGEPRQ